MQKHQFKINTLKLFENVFDSKGLHQKENEDVKIKELEWSIYLAKI